MRRAEGLSVAEGFDVEIDEFLWYVAPADSDAWGGGLPPISNSEPPAWRL